MQTVRDADGETYLLVTRSGESSRVRDPETGAERSVPTETLEAVDDASPLATAATAVSAPVRRVLRAAHDDRSLGLLVALVDDGPLPVTALLDDPDLCESDLHGRLTEFRVAGLIEEVDVGGRRGYAATAAATDAVRSLRAAGTDSADGAIDL